MLERDFQAAFHAELRELFPGCIILKNNPNFLQGVPDTIILFGDRWATLELKKGAKASRRPNQDYYVERMNSMAYSAFVYPENKERVIHGLQVHFAP